MMEKLDRAFANDEWINTYPSYALKNFPILHSDYGPIILDFDLQLPFKHRPFRFEHMWFTHPSWKEVVQKAQDFHTSGSRAFQFKNKISNLRSMFLKWNKDTFGKVENDIFQKQIQLQQLQNLILTIEDVREECFLREELETLMN